MHELSLCENILSLLEESAQKEQFTQVLAVHLRVGELSCVETSALLFCFDAIKSNTLAHAAQLVIEKVTAQAQCRACGALISVQTYAHSCSCCQSTALDIIAGEQIQIQFLEVC